MSRPHPPAKVRRLPPAFLSDKATLTISSTRDESGERVLLLSWHQDEREPGQMQLTDLDVARLRDFCSAWLDLVPP